MVLPQPATKHHVATHSLLPSATGERNIKVRKLMGLDKNGLITEIKIYYY